MFHVLALLLALVAGAVERPNILWLSAEDINAHIGCFGDDRAITPHLDQLAREGVRFTNVFTAAGVCAPCRSTIITGMYQTTIGTHHMRCKAKLPAHIRAFPAYLREAGYYCSNKSKTDYQFSAPKDTWDASSGKAHWRNRKPGQPFFAVFNFTGCHESGIASESKYKQVTKALKPEQRQDPDRLTLPPYYPDTPVTREDWKRNYELITALDDWVGGHIADLKAAGLYDKTIIMFWSDHGVGLPRAKRWLYDSGTHIPFILRMPGDPKPGSSDEQLISSLDFGPTVLNLAGVPVPAHMQGRAFLGPKLSPPREYVFGARDRMDERYDIIRSVRDKRFRYIRNYEPFKPYYQYMNTPEKGATMRELRRVHAAGELPPAAALFMADFKPAEELYDLQADPHEIHNLAADPAHAATLARMRAVHLQWVADTRDIGLLPESEITRREESIGARYDILRQEGGLALMEALRDVANLASGDASGVSALHQALSHTDAGVRYWAAIGLGNLVNSAGLAESALDAALADPAPAVRIAAARALCRMGKVDKALPQLRRQLSGERQWARLRAAIVLDELDELARPALPELRTALKNQPNKYIIRVANRAVNDLLGTDNKVP
jgi:arylsulfatase A-like enzyme